MLMVANDDLLLMSVLTFSLLYLWDSLNRLDSGDGHLSSTAPTTPQVSENKEKSTPVTSRKSIVGASAPAQSSTAKERRSSKEGVVTSSQVDSNTAPSGKADTKPTVVLPFLPGIKFMFELCDVHSHFQ